MATEAADYIWYDAQTSPLHQRHIIFHEMGHMLLKHDYRGLEDNAVLVLSGGPDDLETIRSLLPRIRYSSVQEQQAEIVATLLLEKVGDLPRRSRMRGIAGALEAALGYLRSR